MNDTLYLPTPESVTQKLEFKPVFITLLVIIVIQQAASVVFYFSDSFSSPPMQIVPDIFGFVWYILVTIYVMADIKDKRIPLNHLFRISAAAFKQSYRTLVKYSLICLISVSQKLKS